MFSFLGGFQLRVLLCLKGQVQVGHPCIVVGIGHRRVATDEGVANGDARLVVAHVKLLGAFGEEEELAGVVLLEGTFHHLHSQFRTVSPVVEVHELRKEIGRFPKAVEAVGQRLLIHRHVVLFLIGLGQILQRVFQVYGVLHGHIGILHGHVVVAQLIAGKKGPVGRDRTVGIMVGSEQRLVHAVDVQMVEVERFPILLLAHEERGGTAQVLAVGVEIGGVPVAVFGFLRGER